MIVYQTDAYGSFAGEVVADESPLEPGVFLIPAGCVETPPPPVGANEVPVWSGASWDVIADHRGETWYAADRSLVVVDFLGAPSERGLVPDQPPAPPATPDELRSYASGRRYAAQIGGISVAGVSVDTSDVSRSMIADAVAYVERARVPTVNFKASSGWVEISSDTVVEIGLAVGAHVQACFDAERAADIAIADGTVTTTAQIDAWAWPA